MLRTTRRLALTQSSRRRRGPHRLSSFHRNYFRPLLLIAGSWLERGEERLEVQNWGLYWTEDGGRRRGTRQGQGDGRSLGTEELPISQLPLLNTGITEEAETVCASLWFAFSPNFTFPLYHLFILVNSVSILYPYSSLQFLFFSVFLCLSFTASLDFTAFDAPCWVFFIPFIN